MQDNKIIVNVLGVSNMSGLLEQSPNGDGILGNVQFVFDERRECDYAIIINQIAEKKHVLCDPNNIWAFMVEPAIDGFFDFTTTGHDQYAKVFTTVPYQNNSKYVKSHTIPSWYFPGSYNTLENHPIGEKQKQLSCIASRKSFLPGHQKRVQFIEQLKKTDLGMDYFGRGTNPIESKWDGLYPYKFSLAIENSSLPDYWTEKISDCFMAYTIPIYYGCTNIHDYFPEGSILQIDINDVDGAVKKIKDAISGDQYEKNLNALMDARNLYINKYHFFPSLARYIMKDVQTKANRKPNPEFICLNPYKQSAARNIINIFKSQIRKLRD